jgi:hypothetical protein
MAPSLLNSKGGLGEMRLDPPPARQAALVNGVKMPYFSNETAL